MRWWVGLLLLGCGLTSPGCRADHAAGNAAANDDQPVAGPQWAQPAGLDPPALALAWPPDDAHRASATLSFTGYNTAGISAGSSKTGTMVQIRAGAEAFGWAIIKVGGFNAAKSPYTLTLDTYAQPSGTAWLALGNFARGGWEWRGEWRAADFAPGAPQWTLAVGTDYISPNGNVFAVLAVAAGSELDLSAGHYATLDQSAGPPFPRLGMWYPDFDRDSVADCARYDVVIDSVNKDLHWDPAQGKWSAALRAANPDVVLLQYTAFSEISYGPNWEDAFNPWLPSWPAGWFLTEAGTTLDGALSAGATQLTVSAWEQSGPAFEGLPTTWEIFHVDGDVQCGGEIMTVTALDAGSRTLTVERGRYGTAAIAHAADSRIAPLIRFWPGTFMMNLTSTCPTAQLHGAVQPETWSQYYLRMCQAGQPWFDDFTGDQDGFLFDRMEDEESWIFWDTAHSVDLNWDNTPDSFAGFDAAWLAGIKGITLAVQAAHPGAPILRNLGLGRRFADYNGNHFESWPQYAWDEWPGRATGWHWEMFGVDDSYPLEWADRGSGIAEWAAQSPQPNFTWVETYEDEGSPAGDGGGEYENPFDQPGFVPDYRKMRWGLCSALLCGAYYSYEINTNGHGSLGLLWFDEYDDAGRQRGYLGYPLGAILKLKSVPTAAATEGTDEVREDVVGYGVWGREYTGGLVLVNPCATAQEVSLPAGHWQRLQGHQVPSVNNGLAVISSAESPAQLSLPPYDGLVLKRVP